MKNYRGWVCSGLIFACSFLFPSIAGAQSLEAKDFAVEVAALRSQDCAAELANGLLARGHDAYWLKYDQSELGVYYRVRVGKFESIDEARGYAEDLLDSGLLENCSVTLYEPPASSLLGIRSDARPDPTIMIDGPLANSCPINLPGLSEQGAKRPEDLISVIGKNRWMLSESRNVVYSLPPQRSSEPVNDVLFLLRSVDKYRWRLRNNIDQILAPPVKRPSTFPVFPPTPAAVAADLARATAISRTSRRNVVTNAVDPDSAPQIPIAVDPRRFEKSVGLNSSLTDARKNTTLAANRAPAPPSPKIQGTLEMNNGQLIMRVRNLDQQRSFAGLARVTLTDDKQSNDVAPLQIALEPNEERILPVTVPSMAYGDWMLMVYDERQAVRLIRSSSFGQRPVEAIPPGVTIAAEGEIEGGAWRLTEAAEENTQANGLPNVTGTFDATGPAGGPRPPAISQDPAINFQQPSSQTTPPPFAGNVRVLPRQLAATADNVTLEFEVASPRPLGYITVVMRAGNYQEERQTLMSSPNSRIPFLIPLADTKGTFSYEIRDESGKNLSAGVGDFMKQ